jgi:hypothetical protein
MGFVLLCIVLGALGLLLLVMLVPFQAQASASINEAALSGAAGVEWGRGLFALQISSERGLAFRVLGISVPRPWRRRRHEAREERRRKKRARAPRKRKRSRLALWQGRALLRMVARLAPALRLRLRVKGTVGAGDPADTALLAGLAQLMDGVPGVKLDLGWEWLDEQLDLDVEGSARIWIAHLLCVTAALLWVRENRAALRALS